VTTSAEYVVPTWNQIYEMLLEQAQKILSDGYKPDIIIGIARGGLVPARILSDLLEIRDLATIQIEYYAGIAQTKQEPVRKHSLHTQLAGKRALLVDDVSDGGRSLQLAKSHLQQQGAKEIKIATLYVKPATITNPDYYEKQTSCWIVFPWEAKETVTKIIQKKAGKSATSKEVAKLVKVGLPKQLAEKLLKDMQ